jgi:hypothetical protein
MTDKELVERLRKGDTPMANHYMDEAADRIEALTANLAQATWLLTEAAVQLEEGKIKTRRNRAAIIWNLLDEMKADNAP